MRECMGGSPPPAIEQTIYLIARADNGGTTMKLYELVVIFGVFMLLLAQIPSFHSLRYINLVSLVLCLAYSACATAGSIYIGASYSHHSHVRPSACPSSASP